MYDSTISLCVYPFLSSSMKCVVRSLNITRFALIYEQFILVNRNGNIFERVISSFGQRAFYCHKD